MIYQSNYTGAEIDGILANASNVTESLAQLNTNIQTVLNAYPYQVKHDPEIRLTLEQEYEQIVENNPDVVNLSYVGIRTFLKRGDTIDVLKSATTYDRTFINGEEYFTSYTYTGENMEIATVFYFSRSDGTLNLTDTVIDADEVLIVDKFNKANVPASITNYARLVYVDSTSCPFPTNCKLLKVNKWRVLPNNFNAPIELTAYGNPPFAEVSLGLVDKLIIDTTTLCPNYLNGPVFVCNASKKVEIVTPHLTDISGLRSNGTVFYFAGKYTFPKTIKNIGAYSFCTLTDYLNITNASKAVFDDNWYWGTAPTELVCTATDWTSDINLAVAGAKQSKDWFIDFFSRLHDYSLDGGTHTFKIPSAIYTAMSATEKAVATDKGWTVQGA